MAKNILITGASGLVGTRLTELLLQKGYSVAHLSRSKKSGPVATYVWDVEKKRIDPDAIQNADAIIHLAGAGVADKRWTNKRKDEIVNSRTKSADLLIDALSKNPHHITSFISASGIAYYGIEDTEEVLTEESPRGTDFLANVTREWEARADKFVALSIRVVKLRIGIVLSEKGGALKSLALPVRFGVGAPLASGKQYVSWLHLDDLCLMFIKALEDDTMQGVYNAVGMNPVTNREMTKEIAKVLHRPLWIPSVPAFALKLALGEMADVVIHGNKISSEKIRRAGFIFQYPDLHEALKDLLKA